MNLGILTSVATRHLYFANRIRDAFPVRAVAYEQTGYSSAAVERDHLPPEDQALVERHFLERTRQEERFFGHLSHLVEADATCAVAQLQPGKLNTDATLSFLHRAGVDTVVVFGTNLIKEPLLSHFSGRMVNMHLGLSPYYRGTATNFYPLLNEEPEYVGATIHLIDAGVDSGAILRHARPKIVADDQPHTIGCKAIEAGIEAMLIVLGEIEAERLASVPQWNVPRPRLYLRKHYHPDQVVALYRKLEQGLIPRYVARADQLAGKVRLVE